MVPDLPKTVSTGCGRRRQLGDTTTVPENVTCLACADYGRAEQLRDAENAEALMSLGDAELATLARPGKAALTVAQLQQIAHEHRVTAASYPQTRRDHDEVARLLAWRGTGRTDPRPYREVLDTALGQPGPPRSWAASTTGLIPGGTDGGSPRRPPTRSCWLKCAAAEMTPSHAGVVARILLRLTEDGKAPDGPGCQDPSARRALAGSGRTTAA
jgi:hypothetical protein